MLRETRLDALPPAERGRWLDALAAPPLLEDRERCLDTLWCGLGVLFGATLTWLSNVEWRTWGHSSPDVFVRAATCAAGVTLIVLFARAGHRTVQVGRAPFPAGKYLFAWGYAELDLERLRFVPRRELRLTASVSGPRVAGASRVVVRLSDAQGWTATFRQFGTEHDVPSERGAVIEPCQERSGGYRDAPTKPLSGARAGRRWSRRLVGVVLGAVTATTAGASHIAIASAFAMADADRQTDMYRDEAWRRVERDYPLPWVRARAASVRAEMRADVRARIDRDIREPYRSALVALLDDRRGYIETHSSCSLGARETAPLRALLAARGGPTAASADTRTVHADMNLWFGEHIGYAARFGGAARPRLALRSQCWLEPIVLDGERTRSVAFRLVGDWELSTPDERIAHRGVSIEPELIGDVERCTGPGTDRLGTELRIAVSLFRVAVHRDVFTNGRGGRFEEMNDFFPDVRSCATAVDASALSATERPGPMAPVALGTLAW